VLRRRIADAVRDGRRLRGAGEHSSTRSRALALCSPETGHDVAALTAAFQAAP
jgi:hypothetical protein